LIPIFFVEKVKIH